MTIHLTAIKRTRLALLASLAAVLCPAAAHADAISDLRDGSMLLWLDGRDFNGQDVQGRGEFITAPSGTITTWKDKSLYNIAVGRTVNSSSYAKYLNDAVHFTGEFNGPFLAIDPAAIPAGTGALRGRFERG